MMIIQIKGIWGLGEKKRGSAGIQCKAGGEFRA